MTGTWSVLAPCGSLAITSKQTVSSHEGPLIRSAAILKACTRIGFNGTPLSPTFALGGHFLSTRQKIPFAFNVGTAKIGENRLGEDLASFLRCPSLACCC